MGDYRVISSDNHIYEPADLWTSRIDAKYRDRCPQLKPYNDGQIWVCDDALGQTVGQGTNVGRRFDEPENIKNTDVFENVRQGGYIPEEYIKDLDIDGVDVAIIYPNVAFVLYNHVRDSDLLTASFRVYNDWLAEFCSVNPRRLAGIGVINLDDVQVGLEEMERCRKLGMVGALITVYPPDGRRYDSHEYEPLWALAQDLEIPLGLHAATNRWGSGEAFQGQGAGRLAHTVNMDLRDTHVPDRHNLQRGAGPLSEATAWIRRARAVVGTPFPGPVGLQLHPEGHRFTSLPLQGGYAAQ